MQRAAALADRRRADAIDAHLEGARLAGEVGDVEGDRGAVAGCHDARHAGLGDDRRTHHGFGITIAVLHVREHQRRHPQGAVEIRHRQRDPCVALGIQRHRTGEQVHGLHARGRSPRLRQRGQRHVATEADLGDAALEAFDHPPVDVVRIHAEPALGEEVRVGIRHREPGDVEDADIDRGHRRECFLARQCRRADDHLQRLLRPHPRLHRQAYRDLAVPAIHRNKGHADRARRGDLAGRAAAAEHQGGDVDVVAFPVLGHRDLDHGAGLHVDRLYEQHAVAFHQQQALARVRRGERRLQRVAGAIRGLVQRQLDLVGARIQPAVRVVPTPTGMERIARDQLGRRIEHVDAVLAPFHRDVEADCGRARIQREHLLVLEAAGEVVVPAGVVVVAPVVVAVFAHQGHLQSFHRARRAIGTEAHEFEARVGIGVGAVLVVEQRPHADQRIGRPQHALHAAIDAAAAGFEQAAGHDRLHRRIALHFRRQRDVLRQLALGVEGGIDNVLGFLRQLDRGVAEEIALGLRQRVLVDHHCELGGEAIARCRRAIQVGAGRLQAERFAPVQHRVGAGEVEFHAFRQEFLDAQGHALHRFLAGRVGAEFDLPLAGRRLHRDRLLEAEVTARSRLDPRLDEGLAVRLLEPHEQGLRLAVLRQHWLAIVVAQQRGDAHGLAGAIEVTTRPREHIEPGLLAAADGELGQVQRRLVERQHRHVLAARRSEYVRRVQGVVEQRIAVAVGLALEHRLATRVQHA